tara:strand:+ start:139 stop:885 length:747 start_codon:yes stop_codon:yes gene_type:complete
MSNNPYNTGLVEKDNLSEWFGGVGHSYAYCITPAHQYATTTNGAISCTTDKGIYDPDSCRDQDYWGMNNIWAWGKTVGGYTGSFFTEMPGTVHTDCNGIIGNKYGLNTGATCKDKHGVLQPRYTYINNLVTISGEAAGQIPSTLYSAGKIPIQSFKMGESFFNELKPSCSKVRLNYHLVDSANEGQYSSDFTKPVHVADDEIEKIDDSNKIEAFSNININNNNKNDNLTINFLLLGILGIIVFKLLNK